MIIDVFKEIEDHVEKYVGNYNWNADPLSLTLLQSTLHDKLYPNTNPNWPKEKWIAFYNAVKPFMEEK